MSDYVIVLGWGLCVVGAVLAMAMWRKEEGRSNSEEVMNCKLSNCVEVRK